MIILNIYKSSHPLFRGDLYLDYLKDSYYYDSYVISVNGEVDSVFNKPLNTTEGFKRVTKRKKR